MQPTKLRPNQQIRTTVVYLAFSLAGIVSCGPDSRPAGSTGEKTTPEPAPPQGFDGSKSIREQALIDYVTSSNTVAPNASNGIPFGHLDYDKVIAYDFAGSEETYPNVIDREGKFVPVVVRQQSLSQLQADRILSALAARSSYGEGTAACFQPHFGLVLYKGNRKVNQLSVCLDCNYLIAEIPIPAETAKKMNAGTEAEIVLSGFSKQGRQAITDLCRELNFRYGRAEVETP
ncbi:MAG TPA: hypothetical protein VF145_09185 [Chitinophagaceae bacterium]